MPAGPSRPVLFLLAVAFVVSVVHYADNTLNHADFPAGGPIPDPSRLVVGASWFLFTAFAVLAILAWRRGDLRRAALCLAAYSGSGLVGIGHYTVPGASGMPWWRHAHVVTDIALGVALLAVAVMLARAGRPSAAPSAHDPRMPA